MTLLGIGAMASPRYRPAGLLVEYASARVMIDGGPGAAPAGRLDDWLVSDARAAQDGGLGAGVLSLSALGARRRPDVRRRRRLVAPDPLCGRQRRARRGARRRQERAARESAAAGLRARRPAHDPRSGPRRSFC